MNGTSAICPPWTALHSPNTRETNIHPVTSGKPTTSRANSIPLTPCLGTVAGFFSVDNDNTMAVLTNTAIAAYTPEKSSRRFQSLELAKFSAGVSSSSPRSSPGAHLIVLCKGWTPEPRPSVIPSTARNLQSYASPQLQIPRSARDDKPWGFKSTIKNQQSKISSCSRRSSQSPARHRCTLSPSRTSSSAAAIRAAE
jgi:hypothetical protein